MSPVCSENCIAFGGYDPVGFFKSGRAALGSADHTHEWKGVTWRFGSDENRQACATDLEALAPQFGGYCSFAMSPGEIAPGDPETSAIMNDRLYVNSNSVAKLLWKVVPGRIDAGDKRWQEVSAD